MCAYTNANKCCGFNKIIIIIQTFCCNRMWLHEMSSEKCFYHYRAVADSQDSSGEVITIKEGCRKRHFWYKSQGSSHFTCFKFWSLFQPGRDEGDKSGWFPAGPADSPKASLAPSKCGPWEGAFSSSQQPPPAGLTSSPGLHISPLHLFPSGLAERAQMPWPECKIRWLGCLSRSFGPGSSPCLWLGFPLRGSKTPMGNNPPTCNNLWKRELVCGSAFPLLFLFLIEG